MSLCWLPKRSLLLDEDYSRLSQFAESRGERVLQFARSSERGKRVGGSIGDGRVAPGSGSIPQAGLAGQEVRLLAADSKISSKWALAHIKFFFGGK